jgi:hypothetical protein
MTSPPSSRYSPNITSFSASPCTRARVARRVNHRRGLAYLLPERTAAARCCCCIAHPAPLGCARAVPLCRTCSAQRRVVARQDLRHASLELADAAERRRAERRVQHGIVVRHGHEVLPCARRQRCERACTDCRVCLCARACTHRLCSSTAAARHVTRTAAAARPTRPAPPASRAGTVTRVRAACEPWHVCGAAEPLHTHEYVHTRHTYTNAKTQAHTHSHTHTHTHTHTSVGMIDVSCPEYK